MRRRRSAGDRGGGTDPGRGGPEGRTGAPTHAPQPRSAGASGQTPKRQHLALHLPDKWSQRSLKGPGNLGGSGSLPRIPRGEGTSGCCSHPGKPPLQPPPPPMGPGLARDPRGEREGDRGVTLPWSQPGGRG